MLVVPIEPAPPSSSRRRARPKKPATSLKYDVRDSVWLQEHNFTDNAVRGILTLNDDVLDLVAEAARDMHSIRSFSRTCKRIRARCLPILFQRCITRNHEPISRKDVPPKRLWPFVRCALPNSTLYLPLPKDGSRHLQFLDHCLASRSWTPLIRVPSEEGSGPDQWIKPTSLCKLYNATFFAKMLDRMPRLQVVSFTLEATSPHGLPWSAVRAVLTIPHLRELSFHFLHIAPSLQPGEELALASCAPLTTFYLSLPDGRYTGASTPSERQALTLILRLTCNSLKHLTLPSDEAPVHDMFTTMEWPHLRTLHLRGEPLSVWSHPVPYVSLFARMSQLQRLELELGQPIDVNPRPFWPHGFVADWPLPELRHLTLSCPQVNDLVYSALPSSLRSLSLRYAPHYITKALKETKGFIRGDSRWWWPLLWSSEVLRILRLCRLPALEHLEIEYLADDADDELLSYLGEAFPQLTSLVILRYRARDQTNVPLERIVRAISSLAHLQTLSLHADLPETPAREHVPVYKCSIRYCYTSEGLEAFDGAAQPLADAIACASPASLQTIKLWSPCDDGHRATYLMVYKVVRDDGRVGRAECSMEEYERVWLSRPLSRYY